MAERTRREVDTGLDAIGWAILAGVWIVASLVAGVVMLFVLVWFGSAGYVVWALWAVLAGRSARRHLPARPARAGRSLRVAMFAITMAAFVFAGAKGFVWAVKDCGPLQTSCPE